MRSGCSGTGNDRVFGDAGDDHLIGGPGDDSLEEVSDADLCIGGGGTDTTMNCGRSAGVP